MPKHHRSRQAEGSLRPSGPTPARELQALAAVRRAFAAGAFNRAAELCDAFLVLNPRHPEASHLAGLTELRLGQFERAVARIRQAALQRPRDARIIGDLGLALEMAGNRSAAETAYRAALTLAPESIGVLLNLARLLESLARDNEAATCYQAVLARKPDLAEAHNRLAQLRLRAMMPVEALEGAKTALALQPGMLDALQTLGSALDTLGRLDEAIAVRRKAIRLRPTAGAGHYDLGMTQLHHGRLGDAEASFRTAIALEPQAGAWHRALSHLVGHRQRGDDIEAMERVYRSSAPTSDDRLHVCFGLGKALDDLGAFDEAFDYFLEGNCLKRSRLNYKSEETDRLVDTLKAVFTQERFAAHAGSGSPDATPIFVLGMPRSCTSLVEQVLASHPDVAGGGEFRFINQLTGSLASGPGFPLGPALDRIEDQTLRQMGERYVAHLRGLSVDKRFVTDKLPGNFLMIGMIRLMLPNARIIHCRRDPVDNCLSIFKNYFAAEHLRYAYDLSEVGHYHRRYLELMAHWHRVLPGFVYDISYEALVADFDGEARRLVAHCGLAWRDECGQFFNAPRSVQTASSAQVRQPIYSTSIGQAARYGERLRPLLTALGP
jgi:tetratricopeptide (TPR) repeat protein